VALAEWMKRKRDIFLKSHMHLDESAPLATPNPSVGGGRKN